MSSLKVAVRCRPFNKRELDNESNLIVEMDGKKTSLLKSSVSRGPDNRHHDFTFDHSYWSVNKTDKNYVDQETVFQDLGKPVVDCAFEGYNACVFAYGQTGSGKTYTMMGITHDPEMEGLVPRICKSLFNRIELGLEQGTGHKTQVSYLEIYNEKVRDLLSPGTGFNLRVREHKDKGPYVENLSQHSVSDFSEIFQCIKKGNEQRTTASTNMNDTSSRSHAIFTITFVQANYLNDLPSETISKIHLVDLAGCERYSKTGITGKTQVLESAHINKSLVTLGSVISSLAEIHLHTNKKILYIPYRDSTLTWLLKDSLGGNSKTIMIATISPADCNYGETLSTLRYANRAKNIINKPTINEDPNVRLIKELRDEIFQLKNLLSQGNVHLKEPALKVLEDLQKKEAQEKVLTEEWTIKWREAQSILREEKTLGLKKSGFGVTLDSESPHLIGINDNITGVTLYSLKEGDTLIGTNTTDEPTCDIVLYGMGILSVHCKIVLRNGIATIFPYENAQCWLNANLITQSMAISQGDIILLGRTNMFRYNNPAEHAVLKKNPDRRSRMDMVSLIAASRESLCNSFLSDDENSSIFSSTSSPLKPKLHEMRNDQELHEENKKILETIENALEQLNLERVHMHEHYKHKVNRYTHEIERLDREHGDALNIVDCKIQELMAKQEMIMWERTNAKTQVIILDRQIATLQTQFNTKKQDFIDFVAKELQELQSCGKLDEKTSEQIKSTPIREDCSDLLWDASKSLDSYSSQYLRQNIRRNRDEMYKYESELEKKEKLLSEYSSKIAEMNDRLLQLEKEKLQLKKQSLSLNLKRTTANSDAQTETCGMSSGSPSLKSMVCESGSGSGTCDSFHTANSDCFLTPSLFLGKSDVIVNNILPTPSPSSSPKTTTFPQNVSQEDLEANESKLSLKNHLMSDSGVCLESNNHHDQSANNSKELGGTLSAAQTQTEAILIFEDDCLSTNSSHLYFDNLLTAQMLTLQEKISEKKTEIMKCLETGVDKEVLDEKINQLQDLQRDFVKMEIRMQEFTPRAEHADPLLNPLVVSSYSTRNNSLTHNMIAQQLMARSLPVMEGSISGLGMQPEHFISIGSYMLRGAGIQTHYEYEVRIYLPDAKWSILRRYRRFRELHLSMKHMYGQRVANISFPRKELFGSASERVAKSRRCQLEIYLRRLLVVCSRIPQSPIFEGEGGQGGLTKSNLVELSPFFNACCLDFVCECG